MQNKTIEIPDMYLEKVQLKIDTLSGILEQEVNQVREALLQKDFKLLELLIHKEKCTAKALRKMIALLKYSNK